MTTVEPGRIKLEALDREKVLAAALLQTKESLSQKQPIPAPGTRDRRIPVRERLGIIKTTSGHYVTAKICLRGGNPQRSTATEIKDRVIRLDQLINNQKSQRSVFQQCDLRQHDWQKELVKGARVRAARKRNGHGRPPKDKSNFFKTLSDSAIFDILRRDEP